MLGFTPEAPLLTMLSNTLRALRCRCGTRAISSTAPVSGAPSEPGLVEFDWEDPFNLNSLLDGDHLTEMREVMSLAGVNPSTW